MHKKTSALLLPILLLAFGRHRSQSIGNGLNTQYQKILVLSSGGTMGLAWQLATLKKYEDRGMIDPDRFDLVIGTSAGSIAALLLGSNKSINEISNDLAQYSSALIEDVKIATHQFFTFSNWAQTINSFKGLKFPHLGMLFSSALVEGKTKLSFLEDYINVTLKNAWPERETWVIVADRNCGGRIILHKVSGLNPGTAAVASSAVPALFTSVPHGKRTYIDGGVISSSHLDLALRLRAKEVTLLTISEGFTNPFVNKDLLSVLNKIYQNFEELNILKSKIWGKFTKTNINIIRPTPDENKILKTNRLMDVTLMEYLISVTLAKS